MNPERGGLARDFKPVRHRVEERGQKNGGKMSQVGPLAQQISITIRTGNGGT